MVRLAMVRLRHALLERLQLMQHLIAVERADVARLNRREAPNGPTEMHEVRLDRMREGMHSDFFGETVPFARVARAARGDNVRPIVRSTA